MNPRLAVLLAFVALAITLVYPLSIGAEPVAQPKIPHTLEGRDNCLACHGPGGLKPVPASHAGRNVATCRGCHQLATAGEAAQPTQVAAPVSTPVQAPTTQLTQTGPTPQPVATAIAAPAAPTSQPVAQSTAAAKPVVSAQATAPATAPLPKSGDGDFIIAGGIALALIALGVGMRRLSAAG